MVASWPGVYPSGRRQRHLGTSGGQAASRRERHSLGWTGRREGLGPNQPAGLDFKEI
jgi:hypothetical protein